MSYRCQAILEMLIRRIGETSVEGLLPGVSDDEFLEWFRKLGGNDTPRHNGTLQAVLLVAARTVASTDSGMEGKWLLRDVETHLYGTSDVWPERGHMVLKLVDRFKSDLISQNRENTTLISPLITLSIDDAVTALIPIEFLGTIKRKCEGCDMEWTSGAIKRSTVVIDEMPIQETIDKLGVHLRPRGLTI